MVASWVIGVLLCVVAAIFSNGGLTLQKLNHMRNIEAMDEVEDSTRGSDAMAGRKSHVNYVRQPLWLLGLSGVILGSLFDFLALGFAAQSVVAPLGALTLVSNTVLAPLVLGEVMTKRDFFATGAIIVGSIITVIFASREDRIMPVAELLDLFGSFNFMGYVFFIIMVLAGMWLFKRYIVRQPVEKYNQYVAHHRFTLAAMSGVIGAQSVLLAKCTSELLLNTIRGNGVMFSHFETYLVLVALGFTIFSQIKWLNEALELFDALYVVPVFQSFWISFSVISGLVFFDEYKGVFHTPENAIMFPFGIGVTIFGVYILSQRADDENLESAPLQDMDDSTSGIEDERRRRNNIKKRAKDGTPLISGEYDNGLTYGDNDDNNFEATLTIPSRKRSRGSFSGNRKGSFYESSTVQVLNLAHSISSAKMEVEVGYL